jgi:hypothetical protein
MNNDIYNNIQTFFEIFSTYSSKYTLILAPENGFGLSLIEIMNLLNTTYHEKKHQ